MLRATKRHYPVSTKNMVYYFPMNFVLQSIDQHYHGPSTKFLCLSFHIRKLLSITISFLRTFLKHYFDPLIVKQSGLTTNCCPNIFLLISMRTAKCWHKFKNNQFFMISSNFFKADFASLLLLNAWWRIHITKLNWEGIFVKTFVRTTKKVNTSVCLSVCVNVLNFLVFVTRPSCVQRQLLPHIIIWLGNLVTFVSNHFFNWKPSLNYLNRRGFSLDNVWKRCFDLHLTHSLGNH